MSSHSCQHCSFAAKNAAGLSSHVRSHKTIPMEVDQPAQTTAVVASDTPKEETKAPVAQKANHGESGHVCEDCNVLPAGSVEVVSLLLVLVFALSAVLLTSVYVLEMRG